MFLGRSINIRHGILVFVNSENNSKKETKKPRLASLDPDNTLGTNGENGKVRTIFLLKQDLNTLLVGFFGLFLAFRLENFFL